MNAPTTLTLMPIGILHCAQTTKVEAPRQPAAAEELTGVIELQPSRNFEHAIEDLAGWERIWVIFWFHHNAGWRPKVLPPRSHSGRKGVFSTRAPHRPNPLGLSALRLEKIDGLKVFVRGVDLLDGTPVLDIKPYVPYTDAWPDARSGWLGDPPARGGAVRDPLERHAIDFTDLALRQLEWIAARNPLPLRERIVATLSLGPQPHPYRRIKREGDELRLAVQDWRVRFTVEGRHAHVQEITTGYRRAQLEKAADVADTALELHRDYAATWGYSGSE
ncbi:MAG: tRNA (N6-threonylcarbamoyladenosine(37)-N6)-methyltransferase TrmO [Steroidobacteraceae bacterium]